VPFPVKLAASRFSIFANVHKHANTTIINRPWSCMLRLSAPRQ
jgi:hypothetical protein